MSDVRRQVVEGAPELLAAVEADRDKARAALARQVTATRKDYRRSIGGRKGCPVRALRRSSSAAWLS